MHSALIVCGVVVAGYYMANKEINDSTHSKFVLDDFLLVFPSRTFLSFSLATIFCSHFHFGHYKLWTKDRLSTLNRWLLFFNNSQKKEASKHFV